MHEETVGSKVVKWLLIGISALFLIVMLLLPLITVISEALRSGWETYLKAVTDRYTIKAIFLTLEATICAVLINTIFGVFAAWAVTKFHFKGKKLLTTLIDVPVTISPVIAGLIFVLTFGRQSFLYPYLQQLGVQVVFAVPGIVLATIFVTFPSSYISAYQMGISLWRCSLCSKSHGGIRSSFCFIRTPQRKDKHLTVARRDFVQ